MSWIQKLYETYENNKKMIGAVFSEKEIPLLPICHTTQKAQIEICTDGNGNFKWARVIPKTEARTIIPCTEKSGGRTSGEAPHPLCDKLQYIARDYKNYGGMKKSYNDSYLENLEKWCSSKYSDPKIEAIYKYLLKGEVIKDLIKNEILYSDKDGKLLKKWENKDFSEKPKIFETTTNQDEAFVRWIVEIPEDKEPRLWKNEKLWEKWINYYSQMKEEKALCFITGIEDFYAEQHPAKIRNDGDKAKLISSNDKSGFTFRGRFKSAKEAASTGYVATQKAHLALRWLINRQGYFKGELAIVAWSTNGREIPQPADDTYSFLGYDQIDAKEERIPSTSQELALKLNTKIAGYISELGNFSNIVIMGLDSATQGRLAILYYCELLGSDFLNRLNDWHLSCAWNHTYRKRNNGQPFEKEKSKEKYIRFCGAPAPKEIITAAYGERVDEKFFKACFLRLMPCIIEGSPLPRDLVANCVRRATRRPTQREGKKYWEWNKTLTIACALYRKYHRKEEYDMSLDKNRKTRDYLFGRLLAMAENLENWALKNSGENRETNAARLMHRFSERPFSTWRTIELALNPYKARLGGKASKLLKTIDEIMGLFNENDFVNDTRLSGEFLLGYHCQREENMHGKSAILPEAENTNDTN